MTSNRYFFIVLLFLYTLLFIKGYANTTKEFSDVIVPEFPLQVKFANELVDLDRLDMYERFDRELTTLCYMHSSTSLAIKRANRYFPILEPILKEEKVPTDFLYLAVIESTLNPRAVSPAKAVGIWQIMPRTGREYGLEVNNDIDERYHIEKSTRAACKYLKDAYEILKDNEINNDTRLLILPASAEIYKQAIHKGYIDTFIDAGAIICNPGCGPCLGGHMGVLSEGETCVSTTNRNFKGRMGDPKSSVYLANSKVVAASAIEGVITNPKDL